ncbi:hypothetical protein ATY76_03215 [Rhizobium sp. R339]|nr:hypothetical protein ATY76_03215 [Rhizobium sp. R339]
MGFRAKEGSAATNAAAIPIAPTKAAHAKAVFFGDIMLFYITTMGRLLCRILQRLSLVPPWMKLMKHVIPPSLRSFRVSFRLA